MIAENAAARFLMRSPAIAVALYLLTVLALIAAICAAILDIAERRSALADTTDLLAQLQGRGAGSIPGGLLSASRPGSPFLEGPTVTVAGAALLQRVATAVQTAGGTVQSSQVDVLGTQARDGFVTLLMSCELEQPALQRLLHDLEAGMPFLFVDQLDVQTQQISPATDTGAGRVRVVLGVSGQWQQASN
jgi:general secretion pathway protein M